MTTGYVYEPTYGQCIFLIKNDRDVIDATAYDGKQVGVVAGSRLCDMKGNLLGYVELLAW